MSQDEKDRLRADFVKTLNEIGIRDIKDVIVKEIPNSKQNEIWVIK